jgi:HK97 gp10 family phage protein
MAKAFSFAVDFSEIDKMLAQLPKSMSKTVMRKALKKSAKPIKQAAESAAPEDDGVLKESFEISPKRAGSRPRSKNGVYIFVGSTAPHAWLVEHGSGPRAHESGKSTGQMPANPFFRNAWDANKNESLKILTKEIEVELLKAAKRLSTRAQSGKLGKAATKALLK